MDLWILYNLEQVRECAGRVINHLVTEVPALRILATSRESLSIDAESLVRLSPLSGQERTRVCEPDRSFTHQVGSRHGVVLAMGEEVRGHGLHVAHRRLALGEVREDPLPSPLQPSLVEPQHRAALADGEGGAVVEAAHRPEHAVGEARCDRLPARRLSVTGK